MKSNATRNVTLLILLFAAVAMAAPGGSVTGYAYDKTNGETLIGANVFLTNTRYGSTTNGSGYFSIPGVPVGEYVLVCRYMGYTAQEKTVKITVGDNVSVHFHLNPETLETEAVTVTADSLRTSERLFRQSISEIKMDPRHIKAMPQIAESDLMRSLQTLPGILPISDYSSELYVRGGMPSENLYQIDGADVYNPEHFFGLFSTFNTDAIKNVDISKGGFGAEYGGRLSSVLNVTNLDGNRESFAGDVSVSLLSAKTTLQVPMGNWGSISGSIRRTYFDKTYSKFIDDIPDYYFYDGHLKAFFDISDRNKLTLSTYQGQDDLNFELDADDPNSEVLQYKWGNRTLSARWTHIFSPQLFSNFWVTQSYFSSDFDFELLREKNEITDLTFKGNLNYYWTTELDIQFGYEIKNLAGFLKEEFPGGTVDASQKARHYAAYSQVSWSPNPLWDINAGMRYNAFDSDKLYSDWSPRLSLKYRLDETSSLKAAFGMYHQYLYKIPRAFIVDIWTTADEYYDGSDATHFILGYQKELFNTISLEIEAYYKDYDQLYVYDNFYYVDVQPTSYNDKGQPVYGNTEGLFLDANGNSYGLELLVRRDTGVFTGWLSGAIGKTEYQVDGLNQNAAFPPRHDRLLTMNMVGNLDIRNGWRLMFGRPVREDKNEWHLGWTFVYSTGQPITTTSSVYYTAPLPDQVYPDDLNLYPTERNSFRLPDYARFDLSLTYTRHYKNWSLEPYLQVYNLGNRENVWFITYERDFEDNAYVQDTDVTSMLPLLPTLGVNIHF